MLFNFKLITLLCTVHSFFESGFDSFKLFLFLPYTLFNFQDPFRSRRFERQLIYYITSQALCQAFFKSFLNSFRSLACGALLLYHTRFRLSSPLFNLFFGSF